MATYIERGINSANNDGVTAIVLEIDTPGGLSSSMDDIIRSILESEAMIGAIGTVRTPLDPHGKVFLMGEMWTATAEEASSDHPIEAESKVLVTELHGLRLLVHLAPATALETSPSERSRSVIPVDDGVRSIPPEPTR